MSTSVATLMQCVVREARNRNVTEHWLLNNSSWFEEFAAANVMYALTTQGQLNSIEMPVLVPASAQQLLTITDDNEFVKMIDHFEESGMPIRGQARFLPVVAQRRDKHSNSYFFFALTHVIVLLQTREEEEEVKNENVPAVAPAVVSGEP